VTSSDTFTVRHNRQHPFDLQALVWHITFQPANHAPIADAGTDLNAQITAPVVLDGSQSYDPDGDLLTFLWFLVAPPWQYRQRHGCRAPQSSLAA
jgi:hypothetical protein